MQPEDCSRRPGASSSRRRPEPAHELGMAKVFRAL
jgi:hypothetical protein